MKDYLLPIILFIVAGWFLGASHGIRVSQREATKVGAAVYVVDPVSGKTKFMWKVGTNLVPEAVMFEIK